MARANGKAYGNKEDGGNKQEGVWGSKKERIRERKGKVRGVGYMGTVGVSIEKVKGRQEMGAGSTKKARKRRVKMESAGGTRK